MPAQSRHQAPVGGTYNSIQHAGEQTLLSFCDNYPQTNLSFLLPCLFQTNHPENVKSAAGLSVPDKHGLKGLENNIHGERGECKAYKAFCSLARQSLTESILGLFGYKLDNDNGQNLKKRAILNELPNIDFTDVNTRKEHDAIIVVQNTGIILCEVKSSASAVNLDKAEEQLKNSEKFVKRIMAAISGSTLSFLPTIKLIIIPAEQSKQSSVRMYGDCHVVYKDDLDHITPFSKWWVKLVSDLKNMAATNPINSNDFQYLVQFIVGVWTMKPIKKCFHFDNSAAAESSLLPEIDNTINQQEFAPTKEAKKFTEDSATSTTDVFQCVDDISIMYLTPTQKQLYDQFHHALIHAHAGTGKTLLIVFKIIDILDADPTQKVVIVAPDPHHLRIQKILIKHNKSIKASVVKKFPFTKSSSDGCSLRCPKRLFKNLVELKSSRSNPTSNVLIMTTQDFFEVPRKTLMSYDLSTFNVFVDDLHSYRVPDCKKAATYSDIGDFIDTTYTTHNTTNTPHTSLSVTQTPHTPHSTAPSTHQTTPQLLWFAFDLAQGQWNNEDTRRPHQLFLKDDGEVRKFNIPVFEMTDILRNSEEVSAVVGTARNEQVRELSLNTTHLLKDISCGHNLTTGQKVLYEKLEQGTDRKLREAFLRERVSALLQSSRISALSTNTCSFSTVAILFHDGNEFKELQPALKELMNRNFNADVQTIKEQILNNNHKDLVVDHCGNIQSFECATVVYVRSFGASTEVLYNGISRPRTRCVIVDVETIEPPFTLNHVDLIVWKEVSGTFVKC